MDPRAKQSGWAWWMLGFLVVAFLAYLGYRWLPATDADGIVLSGYFGKVENGYAYDRGTLDVEDGTTVVLPDDARLRYIAAAGRIEVYMEKCLSFHGYPPNQLSIRQVRKHMGCAWRIEGKKLVLATYGEFDSRIEGGQFMRLLLRIPPGIQVETRKGLSGPVVAHRRQGEAQRNPPEVGKDGWKDVPTVPDRGATART